MQRDVISFSLSLLFYLAMTGVYLYFFADRTLSAADEVSAQSSIELSLQAFQPPEPVMEEPVEEEIPEPEPVEEEVLEEEPEPLPEPEPVPPPPPKPEPKKKIEPPKPEPKKVVKKKQVKKKKVRKPKPRPSAKQSNRAQKATAKTRNRFFAKVRGKIDRYKTYPRVASRRGIEGSVKVSFIILPDGNVADILIKGPKVFHKSVKKAIKRAFPISPKDSPILLPETVTFTMQYRLR